MQLDLLFVDILAERANDYLNFTEYTLIDIT